MFILFWFYYIWEFGYVLGVCFKDILLSWIGFRGVICKLKGYKIML